ncbi:hypothetical protein [Geodermatophilus amargosae]|uniref:hypothetical protein n=1 Tax=Geodermatophilus amargosae TaxID=1296565 RepID=UPI0034DEE890
MSTEGQDSAAGKHIYFEVHDTVGITDDARAVIRQGVDLVLSAGLSPEQWAELVASLQEAVDRGTPASVAPAAQVVPGLEAWAKCNPALLAILLAVLTLFVTWSLEQLDSDPAPTQVEVNVNQEAPRPSEDEISRVIEEKIREHQQEPPSGRQNEAPTTGQAPGMAAPSKRSPGSIL